MPRIILIIHSGLWVALGSVCVYPALVDPDPVNVGVAVFGALSIINAIACLARWRVWWVSNRALGVLLVLYALDVFIFGHGEDVGGLAPWLVLVGVPLGFGVWSIVLPALTERAQRPAQPRVE